MADIDVKNTSSRSGERGGTSSQNTGLQRQGGGGQEISRRSLDPFAFTINPGEFFGNPFGVMRRMSEEMDRTFNQLLGATGTSGAGTSRASGWYPAIEVAERNGEIQVQAELPGLRPEDINVEVTNEALIIQGERKYETENRGGNVVRSERRYGRFYREVPLPEGVNSDQVKAQFRNGVLDITVPVPQQANKRRQIPIQSGEIGSAAATTSAGAGGSGTTRVGAGSSDR
jgi:HSP20 family protein